MQRKDIKILLLQIRDDHKVRREELESFAKYSELEVKQIDVLNVFDTPHFKSDVLNGYDALYVGGASEANVLEPEKYAFINDCIELIRFAGEIGLPTFASCFGFQLAILAFGGEVLSKDKDYEMGSIPIKLTNLAEIDPVFKGVKDEFPALSIHRQYSVDLPENLDLLANENFIKIYNNVKLNHPMGVLFSDKIDYDFETKYFKVSMFDEKKIKMKVIQ